jgi:hypothetical protein
MNSFEIGKKIIERIKKEIELYKPQKARGCVIVSEGDSQKTFWLLPSGLQSTNQLHRNIQGDITSITAGESRFLKTPGEFVVSKNSSFADALVDLNGEFGQIQYEANNKIITVSILANSSYSVKDKYNNYDAFQGKIETFESDGFDFEKSLKEQIKRLEAIYLLKNEIVDDAARDEIINEIKRQQDELTNKRVIDRKRRRTNTGIREQFLLDAAQNKIKKSKLYDGPIVINGGPGTGKTTLLIHRIQYMLDPDVEINSDTKIFSKPEKDFFRNQKSGWIFFSPTNLLKKYLENAMVAEGLQAYSDTVKTWDELKATLKSNLSLFNSETGRPFLAYKSIDPLWNLSVSDLIKIQEQFDQYVSNYFIRKIKTFESTSFEMLPWKAEINDIKESITGLIKNFRIDQFIIRLNDIYKKYSALRNKIEKEYRDILDDLSARCQKRLNEEDKEWFKNYLKETRGKSNLENEIDEEEKENLINAFEEEEIIEGKRLEIDINKLIKKVIRLDSLKVFDVNTKLSESEVIILGRINPYINKEKYSIIGTSSLFIKYFKPILKGSDNYILNEYPRIYKSFRKDILITSDLINEKQRESLLQIISQTPKNTRIHEDELDFLLLQCLKISRQFYITTPQISSNSVHPFLQTYNSMVKGMVAVDEATDFTGTQLYCMYQLTSPRTNSFTLCGDLMQQTNPRGINNWVDLENILPTLEINGLYKSYRQTPKLLNLAITLFKSRYGVDPGFYSAENHDVNDPSPLILIEGDFEKKIDWLAKRILELYTIYEKVIPNIAIFVKNEEQNKKVSLALNQTDIFIQHIIKVTSCIGDGEIGSAEFIRVININLIKGLEFEAVIFFDIDNYEDYNKEILDKLIYVGISRATYYLALTLEKEYPERLLPIKNLLLENGTWDSGLESDY